DELQHRGAGKIRNWKHRPENRLQSLVQPPAHRLADHQKLVIRRLLNLNEVRHLCDFLDVSEELANAFATGECLLRHRGLSSASPPPEGEPSEARLPPLPGLNFRTVPTVKIPISGFSPRFRSSDPQ